MPLTIQIGLEYHSWEILSLNFLAGIPIPRSFSPTPFEEQPEPGQ